VLAGSAQFIGTGAVAGSLDVAEGQCFDENGEAGFNYQVVDCPVL